MSAAASGLEAGEELWSLVRETVGDGRLSVVMPFYRLAAAYQYRARWTASQFGMLRDLVRAMCLDSGIEQRAAWQAIADAGGPDAVPEAYAAFSALPTVPEPLTWLTALDVLTRHDRLDILRDWTDHFRRQYRLARSLARDRR